MSTSEKTKYQQDYEAFVNDLKRRPQIAALILAGSRARGLETNQSDTDVFVILKDGFPSQEMPSLKSEIHTKFGKLIKLDLTQQSMLTISDFESFEIYEGSSGYGRYSVVHAKLEFDRTDGKVGEVLRSKQQLSPVEKEIGVTRFFPAYLNKAYRSLVSASRGDNLAARLDAATSIDFLIGSLFSFHGRVPPFNKYLEWELEHFPLESVQTKLLLDSLKKILSDECAPCQTELLKLVMKMARDQGYAGFVNAWHGKLDNIGCRD